MNTLKIISFGEVLFDVFENEAHLGGAPLNLAVHLHRLGASVELISAVGNDAIGDEALQIISGEGLSVSRIAQVSQPTGTVTIKLDAAKIPAYRFLADCAYDHIPLPEVKAADLFCFGTLAQRGNTSRNTLLALLKQMKCKIFYDVNLRQNFYSKAILEHSLAAADMVKLNDEELTVISELFGLEPECGALAKHFDLDVVILTLGARGCEIWHDGNTLTAPASPVEVVSTVGAGDAFSAGFLFTYLSGGRIAEAAKTGNQLAAKTAATPGAF